MSGGYGLRYLISENNALLGEYLLQYLLEFDAKQWTRLCRRHSTQLQFFVDELNNDIQCDRLGEFE